MKTLLALIIGLTSLSSYAAVTNNMISFDVFKAYTAANAAFTHTDYDDSDIEDTDDTRFSFAALYGRRIMPHFQVLGLLDYTFNDDEGSQWDKDFEYGVGIEYNLSETFANSFYVSALVSRMESQSKYEGDVDTDVMDSVYLTFGKRFPIVGKTAFLTYSPDVTIKHTSPDEDDMKYIDGSTNVILNFLKLDLLF